MSDTMRTLALTDTRTLRLYSELDRVIVANKSGAALENAMDAFECHLRVKYNATEQECNDLFFALVEKQL